jgi:putative ABC transport system permease protein
MKARVPLLTEFREALRMALNAIGAHKLRSGLTLLGILVGVFSIILVMTAIRALQGNLEKEMAQLGSHTFQVQRWPAIQVDDDSEAEEKYSRRKRFTVRNAEILRERATLAGTVGLSSEADQGEMFSKYRKTNPNVSFRGLTPEAFQTRNLVVAEGRALAEVDMEGERHVGVLGSELAKKLFPFGSALGEWVQFRGVKYTVVGVLEAKGSIFGASQDAFLAVPLPAILNRYGREIPLTIQVQARTAESFDDAVEQVRGLLRTLRKVPPGESDDFEIVSNDSLINQFRSITLAIRSGAGIISSIALLAAGVGIMNIMLVSVTERTKEIGIRRAIGAKKRNIMVQFIMEAVVLSELGGIIGILLGILAGNLAALALATPPVFPWDWALIGLVVCSFVGVGFGTYPAWKAANLDPIDSLRYE